MIIGVIRSNNIPLPFANVYISDLQGLLSVPVTGTVANAEGEYIISASEGQYLTASLVGKTRVTKLIGADDGIINFDLVNDGFTLPVATIFAEKPTNWKLIVGILLILAIAIYYYNE